MLGHMTGPSGASGEGREEDKVQGGFWEEEEPQTLVLLGWEENRGKHLVRPKTWSWEVHSMAGNWQLCALLGLEGRWRPQMPESEERRRPSIARGSVGG